MIRVILFLVGLVSLMLFLLWSFSMSLFVLSESSNHGAIAYTPRWIFLFSIFVFFYGSRPVQRMFTKMEEIFF